MIFQYTQPKGEGDIKCPKDCMIRAVSNLTDKPYKLVHSIMYRHGWRANRSNSHGHWEDQLTKTLDELGVYYKKVKFPAIKGQKRMTAKSLDESKSYIIRVSKHVACLKKGVLMDTYDCSDKCVYFAFEIY